MSETSEDKSKRNYLKLLQDYQWSYQHSIFYEDLEDSTALLSDMVKFKQELRRQCPEQPFLIRIQLLNKKTRHSPDGGLQAYLVILTTEKTDKPRAVADKVMSAPTNVIKRHLSPEKLASIASAIKVQQPHDLEHFFGTAKINRFTVLNKKHLAT
jgi:hypothetical protein